MQESVNILGTEYKIVFSKISEDKTLEDADGYTSTSACKIVLRSENPDGIEDFQRYQKRVLRHELIHAFLEESGLAQNSIEDAGAWARNEEMVDWFAHQSPKIFKVFKELELIP